MCAAGAKRSASVSASCAARYSASPVSGASGRGVLPPQARRRARAAATSRRARQVVDAGRGFAPQRADRATGVGDPSFASLARADEPSWSVTAPPSRARAAARPRAGSPGPRASATDVVQLAPSGCARRPPRQPAPPRARPRAAPAGIRSSRLSVAWRMKRAERPSTPHSSVAPAIDRRPRPGQRDHDVEHHHHRGAEASATAAAAAPLHPTATAGASRRACVAREPRGRRRQHGRRGSRHLCGERPGPPFTAEGRPTAPEYRSSASSTARPRPLVEGAGSPNAAGSRRRRRGPASGRSRDRCRHAARRPAALPPRRGRSRSQDRP